MWTAFSDTNCRGKRQRIGEEYKRLLPFRRRVKCHLLALLEAHHILHVSGIRAKGHFSTLNPELNSICHLLTLLGAHHILHVSRVRVDVKNENSETDKFKKWGLVN